MPDTKVRIQLVIDREIDALLDLIAERERRTRSVTVELANLEAAALQKLKLSRVNQSGA